MVTGIQQNKFKLLYINICQKILKNLRLKVKQSVLTVASENQPVTDTLQEMYL